MAQDQPTPDPALKRLERLVGTWELKGRTLDAKDDNISGRVRALRKTRATPPTRR
jgi:hypothetical protein